MGNLVAASRAAVKPAAVNRAANPVAGWMGPATQPVEQASLAALARTRAASPVGPARILAAQPVVAAKPAAHRAVRWAAQVGHSQLWACLRLAEVARALRAFQIQALGFLAVAVAKAVVQKAAVAPPIPPRSRLDRAAIHRVRASSPVRAAVPLGRVAHLGAVSQVAAKQAARLVVADPLAAEGARVVQALTRRAGVRQAVEGRALEAVAKLVVAKQAAAKLVEYRMRAANQGVALQAQRAVNRAAVQVVKAAVRTAVAVRGAAADP